MPIISFLYNRKKTSVRICVPLLDDGNPNLAGNPALARHFGQAQRFGILDSERGEIVDQCGIAGYCKGPCGCPLPDLGATRVDAVAASAIGFRQLQIARRNTVPVLGTGARTLAELRDACRNDTLLPIAAACCLGRRVAGA